MWAKSLEGGRILMKLIKCYISSFGKLKDFTYEFNSGLNVFTQENGWGKSTLASFIKAVFYGLSSKKRSIDENDRLKFLPWNSTEKFGGYIVFEKDGYTIKAERYFGKKESDDTLTLTDVNTGKFFSCPEILGEHIFKIDEEGFISTNYFSQKDFEVKSNTSLTSKFNSSDTEDTKFFDFAVGKIEKKIKEYSNSANRGIIPNLKNRLYLVEEKIQQSKTADKTVENLKTEIKSLKEELSETQEKIFKFNEELEIAGKQENLLTKKRLYDKYTEEKRSIIEKQERVKSVLAENFPSQEEIDCYTGFVRDFNFAVEKKNILHEDVKMLEAEKKKKTTSFPLILIGVLVILTLFVGIALIFVNATVGVILTCTSVILGMFLLVGFFALNRQKKSRTSFGILEKKKSELLQLSEIVAKYDGLIKSYLSKFNLPAGLDYYKAIETIKEYKQAFDRLSADLKTVIEELAELDKDKQSFLNLNKVTSTTELKQTLKELQEKNNFLNSELSKKITSLSRYDELSYSLMDLVNEKMQIQDCIEESIKENELLKQTLKFLIKADENLKSKYRQPLTEALNRYLQLLTDVNKTLNIDIELKVTVEEKGGAKQVDFYSKGWQNIFEICKRFALTDVLFPEDKPFIILDDPFYNLDNAKLESALKLVNELSKDYQIIYLTCHNSRAV